MSATMVLLSATEAQRLTQRIKITASGVRDGLFKLRNLVDEAKRSNAWQVLGFPSWTAYLADTLADEPMRLGREERQELVAYLSGEGMSTRAIAPIVGVDNKTVHNDLRRVENSTPAEPEVTENVDPATGEVLEPEPPAPAPVTGLDGKTYTRPAPTPREEPPPVSTEVLNAETAAKALGRALMTLAAMESPEHRQRIITEWWPLGSDAVPPDSRALFEPYALRDISMWLMRLAGDLEASA